jgi:hypothetical protein
LAFRKPQLNCKLLKYCQNHLMLFNKNIGRNVIKKRWHCLKL